MDVNTILFKEINDIDWNRVSQEQAASFCRVLSVVNDTLEAHERSEVVFIALLASHCSAAALCAAMFTFISPHAAATSVALVAAASIVASWVRLRKTRNLTIGVIDALKMEAAHLKEELRTDSDVPSTQQIPVAEQSQKPKSRNVPTLVSRIAAKR